MPRYVSLDEVVREVTAALHIAPNTRGSEIEAKLAQKMSSDRTFVRDAITRYLTKSGIPLRQAAQALDKSLMAAYLNPNYLKTWRSRCNPQWDLLGADSEADAQGDDEANAEANAEAIQDEIARHNAPQAPQAVSDSAKPEASEAWLRDLFQNMDRTVTRLVKEKVDASVIKLDPEAKAQIRALAEAVARDIAKATVAELMPPRAIEVIDAARGTRVNVGLQHSSFPTLLRAASARDHRGFRLNIWLTGPTGSGKTTAAENVAKALALPFGCDGSLDADYKVLGFRNAQGQMVSTEFLRIYTGGGVYVADEIDNWLPSALLSLNAALANGFVSTPEGLVRRHPDCIVIACANTWGHGATNEYVGRTKLDAASLDRFHPKLPWPVDEDLERAIARAQWGDLGIAWQNVTASARRAAASQGLKVIVSPRATYTGLSLLQAGFSVNEVAEQVIKAGMSDEQYHSLRLTQTLAQASAALLELREAQEAAQAEMDRATAPAPPLADDIADALAWAHFDNTLAGTQP